MKEDQLLYELFKGIVVARKKKTKKSKGYKAEEVLLETKACSRWCKKGQNT